MHEYIMEMFLCHVSTYVCTHVCVHASVCGVCAGITLPQSTRVRSSEKGAANLETRLGSSKGLFNLDSTSVDVAGRNASQRGCINRITATTCFQKSSSC